MFFFSSRRRHTRSLRDWSSDVCSSDLRSADIGATVSSIRHRAQRRLDAFNEPGLGELRLELPAEGFTEILREKLLKRDRKSVVLGKECRYRWSRYHLKEKISERRKQSM